MLFFDGDSVSPQGAGRSSTSARAAIEDIATAVIHAARKPGVINAGKPIGSTNKARKEDSIIGIVNGDGANSSKGA